MKRQYRYPILVATLMTLSATRVEAQGVFGFFAALFGRAETRAASTASIFVRAEGSAGRALLRDEFSLAANSERVFRAVSRAEERALARSVPRQPGVWRQMVRGKAGREASDRGTYAILRRPRGNSGPHHVTPSPLPPNADARTIQRGLATKRKAAVLLDMSIPRSAFTRPSVTPPKFGMPGGLLEQKAVGRPTPVRIHSATRIPKK